MVNAATGSRDVETPMGAAGGIWLMATMGAAREAAEDEEGSTTPTEAARRAAEEGECSAEKRGAAGKAIEEE